MGHRGDGIWRDPTGPWGESLFPALYTLVIDDWGSDDCLESFQEDFQVVRVQAGGGSTSGGIFVVQDHPNKQVSQMRALIAACRELVGGL